MEEKTRKIIERIITIKVNLMFMIVFAGAMLYAAEMLGEAVRIREILFWASILLMIMLQVIPPMRKALDTTEELITSKLYGKNNNGE